MIVGVIGAGTMGAGIAQVCLHAGHEVLLHDTDQAAIERGRGRIADGFTKLVAKDRMSAEARSAALARLRDALTLGDVATEADVIIEAALEDLELKRTIFRTLGGAARSDTILATNTSALSISAVGESSGAPERVIGLHFFNPAPLMPLVEVILGDKTGRDVVARAMEFTKGLGKEPVLCADSPGFIVNRVNRPFTLEALRMLEGGEAGVEQIDRAVKSGGYPMGPFTLMDLVGLDVNYAVASALFEAFDEPVRFTPSPIQRQLIEAGNLGHKSGAGFYRYGAGWSNEVAQAFQAEASKVDDDAIVRRIELAIINEAYLAVGEGVAQPPDIDRAMKLGANHPYGPFERAGQLGLRAVVEGLRQLEIEHGERFRIAPALWQIASI